MDGLDERVGADSRFCGFNCVKERFLLPEGADSGGRRQEVDHRGLPSRLTAQKPLPTSADNGINATSVFDQSVNRQSIGTHRFMVSLPAVFSSPKQSPNSHL